MILFVFDCFFLVCVILEDLGCWFFGVIVVVC